MGDLFVIEAVSRAAVVLRGDIGLGKKRSVRKLWHRPPHATKVVLRKAEPFGFRLRVFEESDLPLASNEKAKQAKTSCLLGPRPNTVATQDGRVLDVPPGWALLPPGDPGATRRVKAAGLHWVVEEQRGRKTFSRGVWAPEKTIARVKQELAEERSTEQYAKRQRAAAQRREVQQSAYVEDFRAAVVDFLAFHPSHSRIAQQFADAVAEHATPVGSGTVARTQRIPIEKRAEAAVIAWMRHQTTAYDSMKIARVKGERRKVRGQLAARSKQLLQNYRMGLPVENCPLERALVSP